jgi:hypothetical protein
VAPAAYELYMNGVLTQRTAGFPARALTLDPKNLAPGQHEARVVVLVGPLETRGEAVIPFRVQ